MLSDAQLAQVVADSYREQPTWEVRNFRAHLSLVDGRNVIAFPGTRLMNLEDWRSDFSALPTHHAGLGWCHAGFLEGALALYPFLDLQTLPRPVFVGHSMGGAIALLVAALATLDFCEPRKITTFGAPRAGGATLKSLLSGQNVHLYRNGNDPVPEVPFHFFGFYQHPRSLIEVGHPSRNPIECHMIAAYERELSNKEDDLSWVR